MVKDSDCPSARVGRGAACTYTQEMSTCIVESLGEKGQRHLEQRSVQRETKMKARVCKSL